jgi:DNA transposition AAA+ family ATPase
MNSAPAPQFVETGEFRRFTEFCDACRHYRYIGLCYGPPGVGKTLSARRYARWDTVQACKKSSVCSNTLLEEACGSTAAFYTVPVVNAPRQLERQLAEFREVRHGLLVERTRRHEHPRMIALLDKARDLRDPKKNPGGCRGDEARQVQEDFFAARDRLKNIRSLVPDPTSLVIVDESDRLRMASLDQIRDLFDRWSIGFVLIGMPGIEKRLARYPQLYSRVGFVHEFRPLAEAETREILRTQWCPAGVTLPADGMDDEICAAVLRVTGGNFRLLNRLLTQIGRILEVNQIERVTAAVVEAARESLVIGTA